MRYIDNDRMDPYFNLAADEYLLKHTDDEVFSLWRDEPCIIVGKNQNTLSEINIDFVREHQLKVVRRMTGGGAVFHDPGNICYTFIVNNEGGLNFEKFAVPIIHVLKSLGINAEFSGRNDLLIDGRKFSGTAQCKYKNRILHHGTLLFSSDMGALADALRPAQGKFQDKGIKSVSSRVTNISSHLKEKMSVEEFKDYIYDYLLKDTGCLLETYSSFEIKKIEEIRDKRYHTWEWNYGHSPQYQYRNTAKLRGGHVEVILDVKKGCIADIKIYGDFFGSEDISGLEKKLIGIEHSADAIDRVLQTVDVGEYMFRVTKEELVRVLI